MDQQAADEKAHTKLTKTRSPLWNVSISEYYGAVEWVKDHLHKKFDTVCTKAVFDPEASKWMFYDDQGELITCVMIDLMDRLSMVLKQVEASSAWAIDHGRD